VSLAHTLKREFRVAFSRRAQPVWFRVIKWAILITLTVRYWRSATYWWILLAVLVLGIPVHLFWRWKTKAWTQPWGGWSDVDAGHRK